MKIVKSIIFMCALGQIKEVSAMAETSQSPGQEVVANSEPMAAQKITVQTCSNKYKSDLQEMFIPDSVAEGDVQLTSLFNIKVGDDGIEVGAGKCGCESLDVAYINDSAGAPGEVLHVECRSSSGTGYSLADTSDQAWCDNCLEKDLITQVSGTCSCPEGYSARFNDGVVYCSGADGAVVTRSDGMKITSDLEYLSGLNSDYYSEGEGVLKRKQSLAVASGNSAALSMYTYLSLDVEKCQESIAASVALSSDSLAASQGGSSVLKSDGYCYARSSNGTDYKASEKYQRACKNGAEADSTKAGKLSAVIKVPSALKSIVKNVSVKE